MSDHREEAEQVSCLAYKHAVQMHESIVAGEGATRWQDSEVVQAIESALEQAEKRGALIAAVEAAKKFEGRLEQAEAEGFAKGRDAAAKHLEAECDRCGECGLCDFADQIRALLPPTGEER